MNAPRQILAAYWLQQIDKPSLWAAKGNYVVDARGQIRRLPEDTAFDCSGLVACGLLKAGCPDYRADWNAQKFADELPPLDDPEMGDLGFYGLSWQAVIHVVGCLTGGHVISADGATSRIRTLEEARKAGARVRVHKGPLYRGGFLGWRRNRLIDLRSAKEQS